MTNTVCVNRSELRALIDYNDKLARRLLELEAVISQPKRLELRRPQDLPATAYSLSSLDVQFVSPRRALARHQAQDVEHYETASPGNNLKPGNSWISLSGLALSLVCLGYLVGALSVNLGFAKTPPLHAPAYVTAEMSKIAPSQGLPLPAITDLRRMTFIKSGVFDAEDDANSPSQHTTPNAFAPQR